MNKVKVTGGSSTYNYYEQNGFEIRMGKFYDPNVHFNGCKWEIRILHRNAQVIEALLDKLNADLK